MIGGLRAGDEKRDRLLNMLLLLARCLSNFIERVFSRAGDHLCSAVITGVCPNSLRESSQELGIIYAVLLSQDGGTLTLLVAGGLGLVSSCKSWKGADSLAGGAEGDGGERRELQLFVENV